jgi:hypothetical protein
MTNQPTIKKYRRRVSDEQVAEVKKRFDATDILSVMIDPSIVRGVLEADAEVIGGKLEEVQTIFGTIFYFYSKYGEDCFDTLEQFNSEWEEIE